MLETCFIVVPLLLILAILAWFMNRSMDQDRLRGYLEFRGNSFLGAQLMPSRKTWWEQTVARDYEVRYLDAQGHEHFATCTTGDQASVPAVMRWIDVATYVT